MLKRVLTGIKPTGRFHLGNYVGAVKSLQESVKDHEVFLMIADAHSLTFPKNAQEQNTELYEMIASLLSFDIDPNQLVCYRQMDIPEIFKIYWILNCFCNKGLMNRAHAYKAQLDAGQEEGEVGVGLYTYSILMAADILSMDADVVPVGADQKQHVEICRDLAEKVNSFLKTDGLHACGFKVPDLQIANTPILLGTDGRKMSKSYNNTIPLFGTQEELRKKVFSVPTTSQGVSEPKEKEMLFELFSAVSSEQAVKELEALYQAGIGWKDVKDKTFAALNDFVAGKREKFTYWMEHKQEMRELLAAGADKARIASKSVLSRLEESLGFQL